MVLTALPYRHFVEKSMSEDRPGRANALPEDPIAAEKGKIAMVARTDEDVIAEAQRLEEEQAKAEAEALAARPKLVARHESAPKKIAMVPAETDLLDQIKPHPKVEMKSEDFDTGHEAEVVFSSKKYDEAVEPKSAAQPRPVLPATVLNTESSAEKADNLQSLMGEIPLVPDRTISDGSEDPEKRIADLLGPVPQEESASEEVVEDLVSGSEGEVVVVEAKPREVTLTVTVEKLSEES